MSSSMPPPHGGSPQYPGAGAQPPGQGSPYPPAQQGGWQPQSPLSPYGAPGYGPQAQGAPNPGHGPAPMAPQYAPGPYAAGPGPYAPAQQPPEDFVVAWLMAMFLGVLGVDRFYRGFIGLGLLKLITCGGAGIWSLVDLLLIVFTGGRDSTGQQLAGYEKHKKIAFIVTPIVLVLGLFMGILNGALGGSDTAAPEPEEVVAAAPAENVDDSAADPAEAEDNAEEAPAQEAPAAEEPVEEEPAEVEPAAEEAPAADVPATQQALSAAVEQGRTDAESAETDPQRANVLNVRSETLCETVPDGAVQDWIGTVETVDANGEGKAVVVISIEDDIELGTWNNAFSDISDNTLIEQGDPLYDAALELAPGDTVRFSGTLKSGSEGNDACYYTSNLTEVMSIESPDYIMNFSDLQKIE